MLKQDIIEKILDYCLSRGGDFAEVYCEDVTRSSISMLGEKITDVSSGRESGVGIRIFRGGEQHYLYSESLKEEALLAKLRQAFQRPGDTEQMASATKLEEMRRYGGSADVAALTEKAKLLQRCNLAGKGAAPHISQMSSKYTDMEQLVQIANSEGCFVEDRRQKTRLFINAIVKDGGEIKSSYVGPGAMDGFRFYETIDPEECARGAAREAESLLHARPCPTGRMPVVITNGFGGLFFHEACGHSLEATATRDGASEFAGRIGEKAASEKVTLIDDGSIGGEWGSLHVDDEGIPTRRNVLIENGVLKGFLVDRWNGARIEMEPTGSARRESFRFMPTARMTNTYIAPGMDKLADMIAGVERGIYIRCIHAGSVNPATGEFNFNANAAFLIEHGEITSPVREATLIGTGGEILQKVDMVGDDFKLGQGFCYAASGALYIGAGQPSVRISEITVGGDEVC